jgi:hypothetical protein
VRRLEGGCPCGELAVVAAVRPDDDAPEQRLIEKLLIAVEPQSAPRASSDRQLAFELIVIERFRVLKDR